MFFNTFLFICSLPPLCGRDFFCTFALRSGSPIAVRDMEGVAPPLPFDLNPARRHGILCTITFRTRLIVGYLRTFCAYLSTKAQRATAFIGCFLNYYAMPPATLLITNPAYWHMVCTLLMLRKLKEYASSTRFSLFLQLGNCLRLGCAKLWRNMMRERQNSKRPGVVALLIGGIGYLWKIASL